MIEYSMYTCFVSQILQLSGGVISNMKPHLDNNSGLIMKLL